MELSSDQEEDQGERSNKLPRLMSDRPPENETSGMVDTNESDTKNSTGGGHKNERGAPAGPKLRTDLEEKVMRNVQGVPKKRRGRPPERTNRVAMALEE